MSNHDDLYEQLDRVAPISRCADGPIFNEPWQAQAFALTVALHEQGHFSWAEWAACFSSVLEDAKGTSPVESQEGYYLHWLSALEAIVAQKKLTSWASLSSRYQAWERATHATPHGQQILLENDPTPIWRGVAGPNGT